jgi:hypothetical protein
MSYENGGLSPSDVALIQGNRNNGFSGFGGDGCWWIILFLILAMGGWNNGGFGGGFGGGADNMYPWLSNGQKEIMQNTNDGFNTLQLANQLNGINSGVQNLSTQLCNCCADVNQSLCNGFATTNQTINSGFANAETAANARQMADMQQNFNNQIATLQGFNGVTQGFNQLGSQLSNCCCDIREGIAGVNYNNALQTQTITSQIASENCQDRAVLQEGIRDLLANQTQNTQRILDQLCSDKIDAKNEKIADLERQLSMADLRASQVAQNSFISNSLNNEIDLMYNRLMNCPIPSTPVYRKNSDIQL